MGYPLALKISRMGPEQLHRMVMRWNWDGDNSYLNLVIDNPLCSLGTALLLYWRSDPHFFRGYMSRDDVPMLHLEGYDVLKAVEKKAQEGFFEHHGIVYDPRNDIGGEVIRSRSILPSIHWDIPSCMTVATTTEGLEHFTIHTLALSNPLVSPDTETYSVLTDSDEYGHVIENDLPYADDTALCWQLYKMRATQQTLAKPLSFHIGPHCLSWDFMPLKQLGSLRLCSERFVKVLIDADVPFVAYPVSLLHKDTEQALPQRYFLVFPLEFSAEEMLDEKRSIITTNTETGISHIIRPVLLPERETTAPLLFSLMGKWLVHRSLRHRIEQARLTNIMYIPLEIARNVLVARNILTLRQFLTEHPYEWQQWLALSLKLQGVQLYKEALSALEQAQRIQPDEWKVWKTCGQLLIKLQDKEGALRAFERAMHLQPYCWNEYCHTLRELHRNQEALTQALQLVQKWPQTTTAWYELGMAYLAVGNTEQAVEAFGQILNKMHGLTTDMRLHCATLFEQVGRNEDALAFYRFEHAKPLLEGKARVLHNLGRYEEAKKVEQELQSLEDRRKANLNRGLMW